MASAAQSYYELYRRSRYDGPCNQMAGDVGLTGWPGWPWICSIGLALTDTLDDLISDERINPQLAMKILSNFDQAITETLQKSVKSRLQFKVSRRRRRLAAARADAPVQGSLDTYRFCDEVWTFLIKNVTFKMDNGTQSVQADKVKIVSCNAKKPGEGP